MINKKYKILIFLVLFLLIFLLAYFLFFKNTSDLLDLNNEEKINLENEKDNSFYIIDKNIHPNDQDKDGLSDEQEADLGTNNTEFDTDGDGMLDYDEVSTWSTDPLNSDTDGDGYPDGLEIVRGYNPLGEGKLINN